MNPSRSSLLTMQMILLLVIAALLTTTLFTLLFSPPYPASASNLPAIQSRLQASYHADALRVQIAPLELRLVEQVDD